MDDTTAEDADEVETESETGAGAEAKAEADVEREANGIIARYAETNAERRLTFEAGRDGSTAVVAQNRDGYAMLTVRQTAEGDELERYYGFDMALDHAAELLGTNPHDLPVPDEAADMGM